MTIILAGTRAQSGEPPRSTAYYYADLEKLKQKKQNNVEIVKDENELSEYVEANEVVNDGAVREVPPLRDRQWSLPEYNTPENRKVEETYSTAGTFPMPETKEKEPLLAELEVVGRLPLTQLDSSPGVRRSRSWYLCCPNVGDEEISRESSWRYSSLRPVTAPPAPGQNGMSALVASQSSSRDDITTLKAERDALARALTAERQRAATAARAHDARLAELHGVIAELVRRRAADKQSRAIPEEEVSDECESTTQPAGELDNDADKSRTDQNDTSSALSPAELPSPQEPRAELPEDSSDTSTREIHLDMQQPLVEVSPLDAADACDTSAQLSERDSDQCLSTARWRGSAAGSGPAGRCESRQAKLAARVRLRRTENSDSNNHLNTEDAWCAEAAARLALDVCAHAGLREALLAAGTAATAATAGDDECVWRTRWLAAQAEARLLRLSLARGAAAAARRQAACGALEAAAVCVCEALRAADRALEAYDVLLALAETSPREHQAHQRSAAEAVARRLLGRLDVERRSATLGEPLLSPGPWLQDQQDSEDPPASPPSPGWSDAHEARLRAHAAALKRDTVALRARAPPPRLYSNYDLDDDEQPIDAAFSMAEMEAAVMMQEMLAARERVQSKQNHSHAHAHHEHKSESTRSRRRRERLWRETHASETDL